MRLPSPNPDKVGGRKKTLPCQLNMVSKKEKHLTIIIIHFYMDHPTYNPCPHLFSELSKNKNNSTF